MENKKRFEVKVRRNGKHIEKAIFIDGEFFDWTVDQESLREVAKMGPEYLAAAQKDIERHFLQSLSEMVGRDLTAKDFVKALQTGWI